MRAPKPGLPTMVQLALGCAESSAKAKEESRRPPWPMNPFPKGIRPGSATEKVNTALQAAFPKWLEHNELVRVTGCSRGAVAWAIAYLDANSMVRSTSSARHPQYLRYQAVFKTINSTDNPKR